MDILIHHMNVSIAMLFRDFNLYHFKLCKKISNNYIRYIFHCILSYVYPLHYISIVYNIYNKLVKKFKFITLFYCINNYHYRVDM